MKGFVFGKFYPFHIGPSENDEFALEKGSITVLVCAEEKEKIDGNIRKQWIKDTFPDNRDLKVKVFKYKESNFPNTSRFQIGTFLKKWSGGFLKNISKMKTFW